MLISKTRNFLRPNKNKAYNIIKRNSGSGENSSRFCVYISKLLSENLAPDPLLLPY